MRPSDNQTRFSATQNTFKPTNLRALRCTLLQRIARLKTLILVILESGSTAVGVAVARHVIMKILQSPLIARSGVGYRDQGDGRECDHHSHQYFFHHVPYRLGGTRGQLLGYRPQVG